MIKPTLSLTDHPTDPRLERLNDALDTGEPVKIAVALFDLDESCAVSFNIQRLGTNPGLWDILVILKRAGVRLRAE